jgi:predicted metal-dependent peptidase
MESKSIERVIRARVQLVTSAPFWGTLALRLKLVADSKFETMAVDGVSLFVNEQFADSLTDQELRGVLAHEVLHCVFDHMGRRGNREPERWNIAADHAINLVLKDCGFTLPQGALLDEKWRGMGAEQIYSLLQQEQSAKPQPQAGQGANDPGKCGGVLDSPVPGEAEKLGAAWQGAAMQSAAIAAKQAGSMPAAFASIVHDLRQPKVNWRDVLRNIVSDSMSRDYSWSRPNRRHIANGLYLPSLLSDGRAGMIVAIDTSGSLPKQALEAFSSELQAMLDESVADRLTVLFCNREIQEIRIFESGDRLDIFAKAGGGTAFAPVMDWTRDNGQDSACLIYFTDLECSDARFGSDPGLPVIWANWASPKPVPFGDVLQLDAYA